MQAAEERYCVDPLFHTLVDHLVTIIQKGFFSAKELHEAVTLAEAKHNKEHIWDEK